MINHNFKKKFGQNFISDKNLLCAIIRDAEVSKDDQVLEIGAGAGSLTQIISQNAKKVVSYEIDNDLQSTLLGLKLKNTTFVFDDVMKQDISDIEKYFDGNYKLIANLPYYITTPIIFKFLGESQKIDSLCIMVQKEVAERIIAKKGGKDYGVLGIMVDFYGDASITRVVDRKNFYPVPNVDSAVVVIKINKNKYPGIDGEHFFRFIQTCFSMRRKTLKNNLSRLKIDKKILDSLPQNILSTRPETLSTSEFVELYQKIFK